MPLTPYFYDVVYVARFEVPEPDTLVRTEHISTSC